MIGNISLETLIKRFSETSDDLVEKIVEVAQNAKSSYKFTPNPGPQTEAYYSDADILLYGGQAGGGKSHLMLGLASQRHQRSIIFRRESAQADGLEADGKLIIGNSARYNSVDMEWAWRDGRSLKLAGMKEPEDWMKQAGRERDFMGFDEAGEFLETQILSLLAWLRGPVGQRCRLVLASNPPRKAAGLWMLTWFAPWLDKKYSFPAKAGELRWIVFVDKQIHWVEGPGKYLIDGEYYTALSITFIPASLKDNPYRNTEEYISKLSALPEPLRSQLLYGDFSAGTKDEDYQLIPTDWIIEAQNRWTAKPPTDTAMSAIAIDPAGGGVDAEELVWRYGGWFSEHVTTIGKETEDGSQSSANIVRHRRDQCPVIVDVGGGYGGGIKVRLKDNDIDPVSFNGGNASFAKTADGSLKFANKRAEAHWRFREALDPSQEGGSAVMLPPSPELRADLSAPKWSLGPKGIVIEKKEDIKKRLGRSPGKGDSVILCFSEGERAIKKRFAGGKRPKVILGHPEKRRS